MPNNNHGVKPQNQKFTDIWATQTNLGHYFQMSARALGQKLVELGLRQYDEIKREYVPTEKAITEGYCKSTPLKDGTPFYMWHKEKVEALLTATTGKKPLSKADAENRELALEIIKLERASESSNSSDSERGTNEKLAILTWDNIPRKNYPVVVAWYLIELEKLAGKKEGAVGQSQAKEVADYQATLASLASDAKAAAINQQLRRLESKIRLPIAS
jgi:hypothetical protein